MANFVTVLRIFLALHCCFAMLFLLPLTVSIIDLKYSGAIVCAVATFSAIQEGHYIRTKRT